MRWRPTEARWFELYTPRNETVHAVEVLAETGVVQMEVDPRYARSAETEKLRYFVERFQSLAAPVADLLPGGSERATLMVGDPVHIANQALHRLRVWLARHDYVNERLEQVRAEHDDLLLLAECAEGMRAEGLDFDGIFTRTRFLCKCLFACPHGRDLGKDIDAAVEARIKGPHHDFLYIAATPERQAVIQAMVVEHGCAQFALPHWLGGERGLQQASIVEHVNAVAAEMKQLDDALRTLRKDADMGQARANIQTLHWFLEHAPGQLARHELCHITGWCTSPDADCLPAALKRAGIDAIVRFPEPPRQAVAPVDLLSSWWTLPFRPFLRLWGVPGHAEVDPSGLLPVIVPLLFGYMFPDVGHGLMLMLAALIAQHRWPQLRFLVACGISATAFGFIFGEFMGLEGVIKPLWTHPLDTPIEVLAVPLIFGVLLMLLGMVFSGIEAHWRGELSRWLRVDAAILVMYLSVMAWPWWPGAAWLTGLALLHYLAGSLSVARSKLGMALAQAVGDLLLSLFELFMNTLSFARVGAFALAHAALSLAVLTLAEDLRNPWLWGLTIAFGSVFSIVMEGLLVYVQTTRLVLFEFFIRFLHADGRLFRGARPPARATPTD